MSRLRPSWPRCTAGLPAEPGLLGHLGARRNQPPPGNRRCVHQQHSLARALGPGGVDRIYKESHQSVDLVSMFSPVTKWSDLILTPAAIPEMVRKAFKLAQTERPGSVYLGVPEDVESAPVPDHLVPLDLNSPRTDEPSPAQIARAAACSTRASDQLSAGHGAARSGAADALVDFSELLSLPVATTFHGKGVFPDDHAHALGAVGFMSHDYVNFGFDDADVIVSVGYELQEFDPVRINPGGDKQIIHLSPSRRKWTHATWSRWGSRQTSRARWGHWARPRPAASNKAPGDGRSSACWPTNWQRARPTKASP